MGGEPFVMEATFKEVQGCRKAGIMINTFMLARIIICGVCETNVRDGRWQAYFANPDNLRSLFSMDFLRSEPAGSSRIRPQQRSSGNCRTASVASGCNSHPLQAVWILP